MEGVVRQTALSELHHECRVGSELNTIYHVGEGGHLGEWSSADVAECEHLGAGQAPLSVFDEDVTIDKSHHLFQYYDGVRCLAIWDFVCFLQDIAAQFKEGDVVVD